MKLSVDFSDPISIYQEIDFDAESDQIPFCLSKAKRGGGEGSFKFIKCEQFDIIPHAHVTHLETKSHLVCNNLEFLPLSLNEPLLTKIIDINEVSNESPNENVQFIILKNRISKKRNFEGVKVEIIKQVLEKYPKIIVLGINEPSFDAERDDCVMSAHKFLFNYKEIYLIELLNLDEVEPISNNNNNNNNNGSNSNNNNNGSNSNINNNYYYYYYCFLNLFRIGLTDAYPCSPVLYRIIPPSTMVLSDSCLFCKIIRGVIPSFKVYENNLTFAFLDINPLSEGHIVRNARYIVGPVLNIFQLVIPKFHGARLHEIGDENLADILPVTRKILLKCFGDDGATIIPPYNILQNNGRLAHQVY